MRELFKDLGIGVGVRKPHLPQILASPQCVSWGEVITENYLDHADGLKLQSLKDLTRVREKMPVALHGVSLSLGSTDPLDYGYLRRLKELIQAIEPQIVSDHLCWTAIEGQNLHDLLPLPYTHQALDHVVERILSVQDYLGRRILVENVSSYVSFKSSELTEWEFIAEMSERADCGILLDVNNVFVSATNHGFDAQEYIAAIPPERVGQIHLAGHEKRGDVLIDTHSAPVCEEVWRLYRTALRHWGPRSTMIERDENIPEWSELEMELLKIKDIREEPLYAIARVANGIQARM